MANMRHATLLDKLIAKTEAGGLMREDGNWRGAMDLRQLIANASSADQIGESLAAVHRLQGTKTPFSHYLQLHVLDGLDSWLSVNSMAPESKKKPSWRRAYGPPISDREFQVTCGLLFKQLSDLIISTLSKPRGSKKVQELRARILGILQSLVPIQKDRDFVVLAESVLSSKQSGEYDRAAALSILGDYFECYKKEKPKKGLISRMKRLAKNGTTDRVAFNALEALVKCRVINEWGAIAMRDDWKSKFAY